MVVTLLTLLIVIGTGFLVVGHLRDIARDIAHVLSQAAQRARTGDMLLQRVSFMSLWALIFALSFY